MRASLLLLLVLVAAGCKQAHEPVSAADVLARARALATELCACRDRACVASHRAAWLALAHDLHGGTYSADQAEGLATEDQRISRCLEAWTAGSSAPVDAPP